MSYDYQDLSSGFRFVDEGRQRAHLVGVNNYGAASFLHIAGGSFMRGTKMILGAWAKHHLPYPLTILTQLEERLPAIENVTIIQDRIDDDALKGLYNRHPFHITASEAEGWCHTLHESMSTGAIVIAPDRPPFTEWDGVGITIPSSPGRELGLITTSKSHPDAIADTVVKAAGMGANLRDALHSRARAAFTREVELFKSTFLDLVSNIGSP
jgi:hypothetical protein